MEADRRLRCARQLRRIRRRACASAGRHLRPAGQRRRRCAGPGQPHHRRQRLPLRVRRRAAQFRRPHRDRHGQGPVRGPAGRCRRHSRQGRGLVGAPNGARVGRRDPDAAHQLDRPRPLDPARRGRRGEAAGSGQVADRQPGQLVRPRDHQLPAPHPGAARRLLAQPVRIGRRRHLLLRHPGGTRPRRGPDLHAGRPGGTREFAGDRPRRDQLRHVRHAQRPGPHHRPLPGGCGRHRRRKGAYRRGAQGGGRRWNWVW